MGFASFGIGSKIVNIVDISNVIEVILSCILVGLWYIFLIVINISDE